MNKFLLCLLLVCGTQALIGQDSVHTSTVTLSAGGQPYSYNHFDEHGGPAFDGRYEFRLWKYFALEAGADVLLPEGRTGEFLPVILSGQTLTSSLGLGCAACVLVPLPTRTPVTILPFGGKGILPVANGRLELFIGIGGAYALYPALFGVSRDALLAQASLGGRLALDRKRHYWLGTSVRGYSTGYSHYGFSRQTWLSWTADLGFRFGR